MIHRMANLNLIIILQVTRLLIKELLYQVPRQALPLMGLHQILTIHQSLEVLDRWMNLFRIQMQVQVQILAHLRLVNLGQQELIGLQNFIQQYGKKQQLQLIGILHQIGQLVMSQRLMYMLLFLRVQLATLKFQIPVRYQKTLQ